MKKHFRITALILLSLASSACVTVRYLGSNTNPLAEAIESNNTQEASRLLAAGADVNARNDYGVTLLQYASAYKQKDLVEFLIAKGADINAKDNRGLTPLLWTFTTSQNDRAQIAELLIAKGADINAKTNEGVTPLYGAVHDDRIKVAELLINRGAEIDAKTTNGDTPLILVASYGNRDFAKLLIDHGANVNAKDNKGRSPLDWVLMSYALASPLRQMSQLDATKQQVMQEWIQKQYQISADQLQEIQQEVQKMKGQWLDVVKLLIHHGVDINAALKKEGSSILVVAARLGSKDLVEALMGLGANINDAETGETAL
jgi:ankyrin repeat protein